MLLRDCFVLKHTSGLPQESIICPVKNNVEMNFMLNIVPEYQNKGFGLVIALVGTHGIHSTLALQRPKYAIVSEYKISEYSEVRWNYFNCLYDSAQVYRNDHLWSNSQGLANKLGLL